MSKFPAPYVNDTGPSREDDPMMVRVPLPTMGIGARRSGLPKDIGNSNTLEHVGNTTGGPVKDRA